MFTETVPTPGRGGFLRRTARVASTLVTPHGFDSYLQLVEPTWSVAEVKARVVAAHRGTAGSVTLTLNPNRNWTGFRAGQYTQLSVDIAGVRHTRCYSMANAAGAEHGLVELTVKAHPGGTVSPWLVANAEPGMVVGLTPAQGEFTLPAQLADRILLVSGGSGITPVFSMLRTLCAAGEGHRVTFLHYALTEDDQIYRTELAALAESHPEVRVVRVFTEAPGTGDLDGFMTVGQLDRAEPAWRTADTLVCGPAPLMNTAERIFAEAGCSERLHIEAFTLPQFVAEAGVVGGALRFAKAGVSVENDGRPVLLQAEAAGLAPLSGCRMGICHTCVRTLRCGTVRNAVTGELTDTPESAVRICVNVPVGDVEVDL